MQKQVWTWTSPLLSPEPARLVRWGHFGSPVLIFPTAGGDFEEVERFELISALAPLITQGRMKAYSVDGLAARAWLAGTRSPWECGQLQERYDAHVSGEVLSRIREDCHDDRIEPILAGASIGAAVALHTLIRDPGSFRAVIAMSGRFEMPVACSREGMPVSLLQSLSMLDSARLEQLRQRRILLGCGQGDHERPRDSECLSEALGSRGIACRLSLWGAASGHTWTSWRERLPPLLAELL
jgi:esterase/lipase superfamily enzyme